MRRQKYVSLGEAIKEWSMNSSTRRRIDEASVINNWGEYAGVFIAKYTQNLRIVDRVLFIKLQSGLLKQELMLIRNSLKETINEKFNYELIIDIKLDI